MNSNTHVVRSKQHAHRVRELSEKRDLINRLRESLGVRYFNLALKLSTGIHTHTKKELTEFIKNTAGKKYVIRDGKRTAAIANKVALVESCAYAIGRVRTLKSSKRNPGPRVQVCPGHSDGWLNLEGRLLRLTKEKAKSAMELYADYRMDDAGSFEVNVGNEPNVSQSDDLDWNYYSKRCKYPKKIVDTRVMVRRNWLSTVYRKGLAELDGMFTLEAHACDSPEREVQLYGASWLQQGRGYELRKAEGFIAVIYTDEGLRFSFHGKTARSAIQGLQKKMGGVVVGNLLRGKKLEDAVTSLFDTDIDVRVSDAKAIGACSPGIENWCARTGVDYQRGCEPLRVAWAAYREYPLTEARSAILHAIKRQSNKAEPILDREAS